MLSGSLCKFVPSSMLPKALKTSGSMPYLMLCTEPSAKTALMPAGWAEPNPNCEPVLASPDAKVRSQGVETLFREATIERLRLLADKLDDSHPDVRAKARHALQDLASKSQFKDEVIRQGTRILAGKNWRGLEQASILLVRLNHKPAAGRIAELVKFERPEVFVAA